MPDSEQQSPAIPGDGPRCPWRQRIAEITLIFLVFLVIEGNPPPHVNEPHYLCRLKHFWDTSWCAGDLFLESRDAHLVFVWLFGWTTRFLSLPAAAWIGRIVCWLFLARAWQSLSWRLISHPLCSVWTAALFVTLNRQGHLAGEWVVGGVEAKCVAYIFVLQSLSMMVANRWNLVWLNLGFATAFHALVGGWSGILLAGIWLIDRRHAVPFSGMIPGLLSGAGIALAGVIPALALTSSEAPEVVAEANRIYVFERLPHHLAPLTLPVREIVNRFGRHAVLLAGLCVVGALMRRSVVTPSDSLRTTDRSDWPLVNSRGLRDVRRFAWGAVLLVIAGFAIEGILWTHPNTAASLLKYYWFRLTDFAVPMALSINLAACVVVALYHRKAWALWLFAGAVLLPCWQLANVTWSRWHAPIPPADAKMRDYAAWVDVCRWVSENTPADAMFLTPRVAHSFKWRTGRPEVVTFKDIPQDATSVVEWFERLHDVHYRDEGGERKAALSLGHLGTAEIKRLARRYEVDYVVTDRRRRLGLPIEYENSEYVVYAVPYN